MATAPPPSSEAAAGGIPLDYLHDQVSVRLIELPPAILSQLASSPSPIIHIKATTPPENAPAASAAYNAVLCTPTQTYTLRQVSTSNSIFLASPDLAGVRLTAVSTIGSHLELLPCSNSATQLLQPHLKPYRGWDEPQDEFITLKDDSDEAVTRLSLQSEIPVSDGEFAEAWRASGAFEWQGNVYQPIPEVLVKTLQTIFIATTAEQLGIESESGVAVEEVVKAVDDEEIPSGLIEAVLGVVCDRLDSGRWRLNLERCCKITGRAVLQAWWDEYKGKKTMSDMLYVGFMQKWKTAVPHCCKDLCKAELVKDCSTMPTPNTIRFNPSGDGSLSGGQAGAAAPSTSAKNKWHEKFRKGKIK